MKRRRTVGVIICAAAALSLACAGLFRFYLVDRLTRLPQDVDITLECDTVMTWYFDPVSLEPLPEGSTLELDAHISRRIFSVDDMYDAGTGVIREHVGLKVEGLPAMAWGSSYAVDRSSFQNLADERAYTCAPDNVVDRSYFYYPLFPRRTSPGKDYAIWKEEVAGPVIASSNGTEDYGGVETVIFTWAVAPEEKREANPAIVRSLGLPREIPFGLLEKRLAAAGVDFEGMLGRLAALAEPQELEALDKALSAAVPVKYYLSGETEVAVQPRLGVTVDMRRDTELLSLEVDPARLIEIFFIMSNYASDPVIGEGLERLTTLQAGMDGPQPVFEFTFGTSQASREEALSLVRDGLSKTRWLDASPWVFLALGAALLPLGLALLRQRGRLT